MKAPSFLIENLLIPNRYLVLAGRSGIGKSLLATQLMLCFASGEPWIGFKVKPCICLYLNFELPNFQLFQRLTQQTTSFNVLYEPRVESRPFQPLKSLDEINGVLAAGPKPEVVIIDSFRQAYRGRINDNDQVASWVTGLMQIAGAHGLGLIIVQNTSKAKPFLESGSLEEPIGAIELVNRADSVAVLTASQERTRHGHFGSKASDKVEMHIPKYGSSTIELTSKLLHLNRQKMLFEVRP